MQNKRRNWKHKLEACENQNKKNLTVLINKNGSDIAYIKTVEGLKK